MITHQIINQHTVDALLYLLPSVVFAIMIKALSGRLIVFTFLTLAGTLCHEIAHYVIGFLTNARPTSINIIPKRIDRHHYQMGAVTFSNLRWYNAVFTALAPIIILAIPLFYAEWHVNHSSGFGWEDAAMMFILAPQFLCFWPSRTDWVLALRSWPYLLLLMPIYWYWGEITGYFSS
jgi:hypothetical protein